MIPEERYKLLMQNSEMQSQLASKNVIVFRGSAKDAIDMQLCKMGIVPYTINAYAESRQNEGISKKFIDGLAEISEHIGRPGLEHVAYKGIGGTGEGNRYHYNEQMNKQLEALSKKKFFDFFFAQNPSVSQLKEKLLEDARQILFTDDPLELYSMIGYDSEQTEIINEIRNILGTDRVNQTITAYNEMETLAYEQRHKKFVDSLPSLEPEELHTNTQQQSASIESYIGIDIIENIEPVTNHVQSKSKVYGNIGRQVPLSSIVEYAKEIDSMFDKVEDVQSQNHSTSKVHGIQHVKNVLLLANYIGLMNGVSYQDLAIIREAAIYHDISHEKPGDSSHAKNGANWYLQNVDTNLNKDEVAYLIEAHELSGKQQITDLVLSAFPGISEQRKAELIRCAEILQDADRLDILRYDIENPEHQRFQVGRLNDSQNAELISAVIELNTKQAISKGYLQIKDGKICLSEKSKVQKEQKGQKIFAEDTLSSQLQQLSSETTMSGFNEMSKNVKQSQRLNEQEQILGDTKVSKKSEGWSINDD